MSSCENIWLDTRVSYFPRMTSNAEKDMSLQKVLDMIRSDEFSQRIVKLRRFKQEGNVEQASRIKSNLPAITFCATFEKKRRSDLFVHYNNLLVIDIDELSEETMEHVETCLFEDPYVLAYWKSPSGNGWKGLISLQYPEIAKIIGVVERHRQAFCAVEQYFKSHYGIELDPSGKDITRLCFFSWDTKLVKKEHIVAFEVESVSIKSQWEHKRRDKMVEVKEQVPIARHELVTWAMIEGRSTMHNNQKERNTIEKIYKFLLRKHLSITSNYLNWNKVAYAIANTFHPVYGRKIFMKLCELDGAAHNAKMSEDLIRDAYLEPDKRTEFSSIIYLAEEIGYGK